MLVGLNTQLIENKNIKYFENFSNNYINRIHINWFKELNSNISKLLLKIRIIYWDLLNIDLGGKVFYVENYELFKKVSLSGRLLKTRFIKKNNSLKNLKLFSLYKYIGNGYISKQKNKTLNIKKNVYDFNKLPISFLTEKFFSDIKHLSNNNSYPSFSIFDIYIKLKKIKNKINLNQNDLHFIRFVLNNISIVKINKVVGVYKDLIKIYRDLENIERNRIGALCLRRKYKINQLVNLKKFYNNIFFEKKIPQILVIKCQRMIILYLLKIFIRKN